MCAVNLYDEEKVSVKDLFRIAYKDDVDIHIRKSSVVDGVEVQFTVNDAGNMARIMRVASKTDFIGGGDRYCSWVVKTAYGQLRCFLEGACDNG